MASDRNVRTWVEDPTLLWKVAEKAERAHSARNAENKAYLRAYWDRPVIGRGVDYSRPYREHAIFEHLREQRANNLTAEVVDAAQSIVCRDMAGKVSPMDTEFELQQGCEQAGRLIEGVFDNSEFGDLAAEAFKAGATADIGPCKGYVDPERKEIRFRALDPLLTYWIGNGTDQPRTFITHEAVARDELRARYPRKWAQLKDAPTWQPKHVVGVDLPGGAEGGDEDTVCVVEAWCAAIGDSHAGMGRHTMCVGSIILEDEPWQHNITPVFSFVWSPDRKGYGGRSLARIIGKFDSANRRLERMYYAGLSGAVPNVLVHEDTDYDGPADMEYAISKWSGTHKPETTIPQAVSPDVIAKIEKNRERAFAEGGVNQGMATGNAPARYTSGAAQREYVDIANTRLLRAQKQWEKFWRAAARVVVMLAQQARESRVKVKGASYYESVKFPKLKEDSYKVSFGLSSGLALTPSSRKEELSELQQMGVIDTAEVARSLSLPDTKELADRLNAPRDLVLRQISICLNGAADAPFPMPSAMMDLTAGVRIGGQEYQRAMLQGNYPPANTERLRRWIKACQSRMAAPPATPQPQPAPISAPVQALAAPPTAAPPVLPAVAA